MKTTMLTRTSLFNRRTFRQGVISAFRSVKMKLLLSCCVVFILLTLSSHAPSILGWKQISTAYITQSSRPRKGYTLLINTWKRNDLLKKSISHYKSCPGLDSIHIVWSEPDLPSDSLIEYLNNIVQSSNSRKGVDLKFDINKEDSLNNRFKEIVDLKTDAIFSIDDDVIFHCKSVELAFTVWKSAPETMVGFVPRMHWIDDKMKSNEGGYIYGGWWSVWWMGKYSMVLSKAAFFHRKYLSLYTYHMPSSIREYISKNRFILFAHHFPIIVKGLIGSSRSSWMTRNCEDIAMSFLVANATGVPPIWVKGKINEIGSTGISSMGGHSKRRTECINWFLKEYGRMPLLSTSVKAVDAQTTWFW